MTAMSPDAALHALRTNFAATRVEPTTVQRLEEAEAERSLTPMQLLAVKIDGQRDGIIRRERRLVETLLIVIDDLQERLASLEEELTRP